MKHMGLTLVMVAVIVVLSAGVAEMLWSVAVRP